MRPTRRARTWRSSPANRPWISTSSPRENEPCPRGGCHISWRPLRHKKVLRSASGENKDMSPIARTGIAAALVIVTMPALGAVDYYTTVTLKIGDAAPPMKVQAWVRGQPVTQFEKGKVYVLDFWATWCGGCIVSFPKISAVAEKYKDQVVFTSIDTYEEIGDRKVADPVAKVTEFLKKDKGQKLKLDVCDYGNTKSMWDAWIKPLRRAGLPTTVVIDQEGKIAWIDVNLDHLSWVLDQVLAKKWDREKAAAVMQQKDAVEDMMFKLFRSKGDDHVKACQALL